jgi:hypothetical protein
MDLIALLCMPVVVWVWFFLAHLLCQYLNPSKTTTVFVTDSNDDTSFIDTAMWLSMEGD